MTDKTWFIITGAGGGMDAFGDLSTSLAHCDAKAKVT